MTVEKSIEELRQEATDIQVGTVESLNKMREEIQLWRDTDAARDARNNTIREELEGEIEKLTNLITVVRKREIPSIVKSPNQQRAELIQRARNFVVGQRNKVHGSYIIERKNGDQLLCDAKFVHDLAKRTTTCTLMGLGTGYTRKKAVARCHPNEVFNGPLGEVVSLCKALKIDIPQEFIDAVRPDEVVVGMVTQGKHSGRLFTVKEIKLGNKIYSDEHVVDEYTYTGSVNIIDDTNAEYEFGSVGEQQ